MFGSHDFRSLNKPFKHDPKDNRLTILLVSPSSVASLFFIVNSKPLSSSSALTPSIILMESFPLSHQHLMPIGRGVKVEKISEGT